MKHLWEKFKNGLFTKTQFLTGMTLSFILISSFVYAFNQLSLNIFSSGAVISSAEVNANFEYVNERIEAMAEYSHGFSVETSGPVAITSVARTVMQYFSDSTPVGTVCCTQYPRLGTFFDTFDPDQVSEKAANYITDQYYEIPEDGYYLMYFSAKPSAYHSSSAYGVIYRKSPTSAQVNSLASREYGWSSVSTGASVSRYLRSGDKIFFNIRKTSAAGTFNFEPGIKFTVKKL
jgi:hypothetical protein